MSVVVAGGGLAGAAAAAALARAGREVTLIERETAPVHKICGEFLSGEAQRSLAALGVDLAALGGHAITHVRLIRGARVIRARLPFQGLGLTRRTLDEVLLRHAAAAGATVRRGESVRRIHPDLSVELATETLRPETLLLATGKHEARGAARPARPGGKVGMKTYFRLEAAQHASLAGHVELVLFPGGYAGLQLVEGEQANLCLLIDAALLRRLGGRWPAVLDYLLDRSPHLAMRLAGAVALLPAPLTIARVPYGFLHRPGAQDPARLFRLGDQAAVIHSFTGDGMAIALHSAARAVQFHLAGADAAAYHRRLRADVAGQLRRAELLHRLLAAPYLGAGVLGAAAAFPAALGAAAAATRVRSAVRLT